MKTLGAAEGAAFSWAGGLFSEMYRQSFGPRPDLSKLEPTQFEPTLLVRARAAWCERFVSEFRSIQIMSRFLAELVAAAEPIDIYAGALELIRDEVRHTELCAAVCERLGATPRLPHPAELRERGSNLDLPASERALVTALGMLCINETLSVGFIEDLALRCENPSLRALLADMVGDEEQHQEFGWSYLRRALLRLPESRWRDVRGFVAVTLAPHEANATRALADVPAEARDLELFPEPELAALALFSPARQALVYRRCLQRVLLPKLAALDIAPSQ